MKLSSAEIECTLDRHRARAVPADHPAAQELGEVFGDHTFFVDEEGLSIVEPAPASASPPETGQIVKIASWVDASYSALAPHEREWTDIVVPLSRAA
jgi:hypothetical protein